MAMSLLLALCLLLVMGSLIMTLSSSARVDELNKQNQLMQREMEQLRKEYVQLVQQVQMIEPGISRAVPASGLSAPAPAPALRSEELALLNTREKQELLKQQAFQFQALLEAFALQNQGEYPDSLNRLQRFLERTGSHEWYFNPYTSQRNPLTSEDSCLDITHDAVDEGLPEHAGKLLYQAHFDEEGRVRNYSVAVFDEQGVLLRQDDGSLFTLSHTS